MEVDINQDPAEAEMVLMSKGLFEFMVSSEAERSHTALRITWGQTHHITAPTLAPDGQTEIHVWCPAVTKTITDGETPNDEPTEREGATARSGQPEQD